MADREWSELRTGTVSGTDDVVDFKVSNDGHTLIADHDWNRGNERTFDRQENSATTGHHDHYGPGNGPNNNGTDRGWYNGPGSK